MNDEHFLEFLVSDHTTPQLNSCLILTDLGSTHREHCCCTSSTRRTPRGKHPSMFISWQWRFENTV